MKKRFEFTPNDKRIYKPFRIADVATRPGCLAVLQSPSRVAGTLFYPDGRVVK